MTHHWRLFCWFFSDARRLARVHARGVEGFLALSKLNLSIPFNGYDALTIAIDANHLEIVELLLKRRAYSVSPQYTVFGSALIFASEFNKLEATKLLLSHSYEPINAFDQEGRTALDCAEAIGHHEIARLIASNGGKRAEELRSSNA